MRVYVSNGKNTKFDLFFLFRYRLCSHYLLRCFPIIWHTTGDVGNKEEFLSKALPEFASAHSTFSASILQRFSPKIEVENQITIRFWVDLNQIEAELLRLALISPLETVSLCAHLDILSMFDRAQGRLLEKPIILLTKEQWIEKMEENRTHSVTYSAGRKWKEARLRGVRFLKQKASNPKTSPNSIVTFVEAWPADHPVLPLKINIHGYLIFYEDVVVNTRVMAKYLVKKYQQHVEQPRVREFVGGKIRTRATLIFYSHQQRFDHTWLASIPREANRLFISNWNQFKSTSYRDIEKADFVIVPLDFIDQNFLAFGHDLLITPQALKPRDQWSLDLLEQLKEKLDTAHSPIFDHFYWERVILHTAHTKALSGEIRGEIFASTIEATYRCFMTSRGVRYQFRDIERFLKVETESDGRGFAVEYDWRRPEDTIIRAYFETVTWDDQVQ